MLKQVKGDTEQETYLQEAIRTTNIIIRKIDTSILKKENAKKLLELQEAFNVSPLISTDCPGRELIRWGNLRKLCHNGYKSKFAFISNY